MTKLDLYCGLLGAGKTTLIKQLVQTVYRGRRTAVIENEIGAVNLDAGELRQTDISVTELTSGCICCTVSGSFVQSLERLTAQEHPEYILIEPSGAADLGAILSACKDVDSVSVNRVVMVVNAKKIAKLLTIIGAFFREQVRLMDWIYLNFTETMTAASIEQAKEQLLNINPNLRFIQTPLREIKADAFPEPEEPLILPDQKADLLHVPTAASTVQMTWSYRFTRTFCPESLPLLKDYLRGPAVRELWRIKGYLRPNNGRFCKIDYTFGEWFFEERDADMIRSDAVNLFVFIGGRFPIPWLEQKIKQFETNAPQ